MTFDVTRVREAFPGRTIEWLETTPSTMKNAQVMVQAGALAGSIVGAEHQSAGQGRLGRSWVSTAAEGLYFTLIFRLNLHLTDLPVLTIAMGLAIAQAIRDIAGLECDLKWPNDLLIDGKKCCGILSEFQEGAVMTGIGVNVNQIAFPSELKSAATSLRIAGGREFSREQLLIRMIEEIDNHVELLERQGRAPLLDLFGQSSSFVSGKRVEVEQAGRLIRGITDGLSDAGFLYVRDDAGERVLILAGGLRAL